MQCVRAMFGSSSYQCLFHEDAICSVDPLSSEDVAVVVDFHWFTDCHLEAIFNRKTSRVQLRSSITVDGKDVRLTTGVSLNPVQRDILPHRQSQLYDLTIRLHITTYLKSICITETVTLSPNTQTVLLTRSTFSMSIT